MSDMPDTTVYINSTILHELLNHIISNDMCSTCAIVRPYPCRRSLDDMFSSYFADIYKSNKTVAFGSTMKEDENQKPKKKSKKKVKKSPQLIREEKMNVGFQMWFLHLLRVMLGEYTEIV